MLNSKRRVTRSLFLLISIAISAPSLAGGSQGLNELMQINADTALLKAKIKREELKNKFNALSMQSNMMPPMGAVPLQSMPMPTAKEIESSLPAPTEKEDEPNFKVKNVEGYNGRFTAMISQDDARYFSVAKGDHLAHGWQVSMITLSEVTLKRKKRHKKTEIKHLLIMGSAAAPIPMMSDPSAGSASPSSFMP